MTQRKTLELKSYIPLPTSKAREFWTRWKILHIRQLSETGRATGELWLPESERTGRALDQLYLKQAAQPNPDVRADTSTRFAAGLPLRLTSPMYLGDMSFGALSGVPNAAIARAADLTGIMAGTGEGGLLKEVAECSRITVQWASARFGVDANSLTKGQAVVIKIGQGAKPGIGGHLPGVKVTTPISETRRIPVGTDAISPAPHHDIYSIEDLGQRILALKEATRKPVFVKVGATNYIPYIASGVARMGAAGIIIDGAGAGTGAAPSVVKNNVGVPIELAIASVDSILRREGLRDDFTVIAAGRVGCPEDSVKLIALGADMTSLGTGALLAIGCLMVHKCHLGFCPAILTNRISDNPVRTLSFDQSVTWLANMVRGWTEEMRLIMEAIGVSSIADLRSRRELLFHNGSMNPETLGILGVDSKQERGSGGQAAPSRAPPLAANLWDPSRSTTLWELAGTTGKSPGEAQISSMGSIGPPFIDTPSRLSDWVVVDGAQVTRPSIDPYREQIEIVNYLAQGKVRLAAPFFFTHLPEGVPDEVRSIFARTASAMGLLYDDSAGRLGEGPHPERLIAPEGAQGRGRAISVVRMSAQASGAAPAEGAGGRWPLYLRIPSSTAALEWVRSNLRLLDAYHGFIVDEDDDESDLQLELSVSKLERDLIEKDARWRYDILAEGNMVRGSEDIVKLLAMGADCVGFGKAALVAVGFEDDQEVVLDLERLAEHLENLVVAFVKDIKLLAGAAGMSSVASSLVGNKEILRTVCLDPSIRRELGIKPAGAA
ncbi:MAG: FMN-binding glutamate synthase family protein [Nitrososphaerota archaeon]|nr:FMN-binding glutamate synthase family protein [Nitrososphaerota archaeon]MDG6977764.1 FMN-binding glutamate synthase family protein [Nitrososphaerota archaeon]